MTACKHFDAVIVGGGPAGSSAARTLSAAGLSVLVPDKTRFPRDKVCAGWITPQVIELADIDLSDYALGRTLQPIHRFGTGMLGRVMLTTEYDNTVSYGILRREFDHYLLQRSVAGPSCARESHYAISGITKGGGCSTARSEHRC